MSEYPISRPSQIFPGLKPLVACHGVSVTTVEGVGSERKCVHQVQKRIAPLALWDDVEKKNQSWMRGFFDWGHQFWVQKNIRKARALGLKKPGDPLGSRSSSWMKDMGMSPNILFAYDWGGKHPQSPAILGYPLGSRVLDPITISMPMAYGSKLGTPRIRQGQC